jgi:hypothetical protein
MEGRIPSSRARAAAPSATPEVLRGDFDLVPMAVGLWLVSVVRVWLALADHERFDTEATLALACLVLIPWLWLRVRSQR